MQVRLAKPAPPGKYRLLPKLLVTIVRQANLKIKVTPEQHVTIVPTTRIRIKKNKLYAKSATEQLMHSKETPFVYVARRDNTWPVLLHLNVHVPPVQQDKSARTEKRSAKHAEKGSTP